MKNRFPLLQDKENSSHHWESSRFVRNRSKSNNQTNDKMKIFKRRLKNPHEALSILQERHNILNNNMNANNQIAQDKTNFIRYPQKYNEEIIERVQKKDDNVISSLKMLQTFLLKNEQCQTNDKSITGHASDLSNGTIQKGNELGQTSQKINICGIFGDRQNMKSEIQVSKLINNKSNLNLFSDNIHSNIPPAKRYYSASISQQQQQQQESCNQGNSISYPSKIEISLGRINVAQDLRDNSSRSQSANHNNCKRIPLIQRIEERISDKFPLNNSINIVSSSNSADQQKQGQEKFQTEAESDEKGEKQQEISTHNQKQESQIASKLTNIDTQIMNKPIEPQKCESKFTKRFRNHSLQRYRAYESLDQEDKRNKQDHYHQHHHKKKLKYTLDLEYGNGEAGSFGDDHMTKKASEMVDIKKLFLDQNNLNKVSNSLNCATFKQEQSFIHNINNNNNNNEDKTEKYQTIDVPSRQRAQSYLRKIKSIVDCDVTFHTDEIYFPSNSQQNTMNSNDFLHLYTFYPQTKQKSASNNHNHDSQTIIGSISHQEQYKSSLIVKPSSEQYSSQSHQSAIPDIYSNKKIVQQTEDKKFFNENIHQFIQKFRNSQQSIKNLQQNPSQSSNMSGYPFQYHRSSASRRELQIINQRQIKPLFFPLLGNQLSSTSSSSVAADAAAKATSQIS